MDETLNTSDFSHTQRNHAEWQMLGELALSSNSAVDEQIRAWMAGLLQPLSLHADFLNRIARSAQDAAAWALQPELKLEHIHLKIFGPRDPVPAGQTWGFFRVEKVEVAADADDSASHAVEFYLYTEGQS